MTVLYSIDDIWAIGTAKFKHPNFIFLPKGVAGM